MSTEQTTRSCPFCKEEIRADAIRCKHCRSNVEPEKQAHAGVCPYCKEAIHAEALKCKHCGAHLGAAAGGSCEGCGPTYEGEPIQTAASMFPGALDRSFEGILEQHGDIRSAHFHCGFERRFRPLPFGGVVRATFWVCRIGGAIVSEERASPWISTP